MKVRAGFGITVGIVAAGTAGALIMAPMAAFAGPSTPATAGTAQAAPSALDVDNKAKISARGAAIRIPYSYLCTAGWEGNLSVQVVQALGNDLASGYGNKSVKCSGDKKNASLYLQVAAYQGARPFAPGPASVSASLDSFDPKADGCGNGGMPCPVLSEAKPPQGGMFRAASLPVRAAGQSGDTYGHAEVQGTITLVN